MASQIQEGDTVAPTAAERTPPARSAKAQALSWSLYDLANTVFSFNILSLYFPVWAKETLGVADSAISIAFSSSMLLVAIIAPILGAASDRAGRRLPFLVIATLLCVLLTSLLGTQQGLAPLILYAFANLTYQAGLVFYDAMLPDVSTPETVGIIGGSAIGIGYLGSLIGIATGATILHFVPQPHPWIFAATGALFLAFAIPCFLNVREPRPWRGLRGFSPSIVLHGLARTGRDVLSIPSLGRFLAARFVYTDAVNTTILFMGIYATQEIGFSEATTQLVLVAGILGAVVGGFTFGRMVDRFGAKATLQTVLGVWMVTLALAALVPILTLPRPLFWLVAIGAGISLGGTWASDRPLLLHLVPPERIGEFYGVYGMVGRFAAVLGPLVWGLIVDGFGWGRPAAILTLLGAVAIGAGLLRKVHLDARKAPMLPS